MKQPVHPAAAPDADAIRQIARDAYIYAAAPIQSYGTWFKQAVDASAPEYIGGFNRFRHYADVFTPENKDIVSPNNDTPYSWAWLDLRAEPMVVSVPDVAEDRYYVLQLIDLFTHNFGYIGTRATGNRAGHYLVAGPNWQGMPPAGIDAVLRAESDIVGILGRTQLKGPADLGNVRAVQAGYAIRPLSSHAGTAPPAPAPAIAFPPHGPARAEGRDFIGYLNMLLQFTQPPIAEERPLLERFSAIGIGPGRPWDAACVDASTLSAIDAGVAEAQALIQAGIDRTVSSNGLFGTRAELGGDSMKRTLGARIGIYGNSVEEAWYGGFSASGDGPIRLRFPPDGLPPAAYFWSMTLYTMPDRLLYANDQDRYSIGSETEGLVRDPDGGLTLHIGTAPPEDAQGPAPANWLPAPAAPYVMIARLYGPGPGVLDGSWHFPEPEPLP